MSINKLLADVGNLKLMDILENSFDILHETKLINKANHIVNELHNLASIMTYMSEMGDKETDIHVVAHERSGSTLTLMILHQMISGGDMDFESLNEKYFWHRVNSFDKESVIKVPDRASSPRLIKSHEYYEITSNIKKGKFIFLIRDGLDAVLSSFHMHLIHQPATRFNEIKPMLLDRWFRYNAKWIKNSSKLDILYVNYEDLINDKVNTIKKMADHVGIEISENLLDIVLKNTSFENMKQNHHKFGRIDIHPVPHPAPPNKSFIRKGVVGDGKKEFSIDELKLYNENLYKFFGDNNITASYVKDV